MRLTDEECILTGAQGVGRIEKQAIGAMLADASTWVRSQRSRASA